MLMGVGFSRACLDLLSGRYKEGGTQDLVSNQWRIWVQGCQCLGVSSCSSC